MASKVFETYCSNPCCPCSGTCVQFRAMRASDSTVVREPLCQATRLHSIVIRRRCYSILANTGELGVARDEAVVEAPPT